MFPLLERQSALFAALADPEVPNLPEGIRFAGGPGAFHAFQDAMSRQRGDRIRRTAPRAVDAVGNDYSDLMQSFKRTCRQTVDRSAETAAFAHFVMERMGEYPEIPEFVPDLFAFEIAIHRAGKAPLAHRSGEPDRTLGLAVDGPVVWSGGYDFRPLFDRAGVPDEIPAIASTCLLWREPARNRLRIANVSPEMRRIVERLLQGAVVDAELDRDAVEALVKLGIARIGR